jgi:diguanylate cyclase (GGDEF)-like protein/PAS domain S-box-containing protein
VHVERPHPERVSTPVRQAHELAGAVVDPAVLDALLAGGPARLVVDHAARVHYASPAARLLLCGDDRETPAGLIELVAPESLAPLLRRLDGTDGTPWTEQVDVRGPRISRRTLSLAATPHGELWVLDLRDAGGSGALLLDLATSLLAPTSTVKDVMRTALERFAGSFGADRASLHLFGPGTAPGMTRTYLWARPGAEHTGDMAPDWWTSRLVEGSEGVPGLFRIDDTSQHPDAEVWERAGVGASLAVQVSLGADVAVSLGMSTKGRPRRWSDGDVELMRSAGAIFGNAILRAESEAILQAQSDALAASEARLRATIDATPAIIYRLDRETRVLLANEEAARYGALSVDELIGLRLSDFVSGEVGDAFLEKVAHLFATGERVCGELRFGTPQHGELWLDCRGVPEFASDGAVSSMLLFAIDVTVRRAMEEQIRLSAEVDALTGLSNRNAALERIGQLLAREDDGGSVALLFVDLDRFKLVNDSLGHAAGDLVLQSVARALADNTSGDDVVARLGGDEFAVAIADPGDIVKVVHRVEALRRVIATPVHLGNQTIVPTASIGVAVASPADRRPSDLLRLADVAMYQAKMRGRNRFEIFDENLRTEVDQRVDTEAALRLAVPGRQLEVHYQPEVLLDGGRVVGVEALVRWRHPERGLLAPGSFVPLAEETGMISDIGRFVLTEACRQMGEWSQRHPDLALTLRVNVSGRQLSQPALLRDITIALADSELSPDRLCLEITETALMTDIETTIRMLRLIRELGVRLAIDDFGTGYSSLGYLERFPVDALKIDRSFVAGLGSDPKSAAIVRTLVTLAHVLDLDVVAEGVETDAQVEMLRTLGCERAQGFRFAPGLAPPELEPLLRAGFITGIH